MKTWHYWTLAGVVVMIAALYMGGWYLTGRSLPHSTTVAGVDVSSLSVSEAQKALKQGIADRTDSPIAVRHDGDTFEFLPSDYDFQVDTARSITAVGGQRSWSPLAMWALIVGGGDHGPVFEANDTNLRAAISEVSSQIDVPMREPQVTFPKGEPKIREPRIGLVVDQADMHQQIKDAYLMTTDPIDAPIDRLRPTGTTQDAREAVEQLGKPAVSGPVTLKVSGKDIELPVKVWTPALSIVMSDGEMRLKLNPEKLAKPLLAATKLGTNPPVDAKFTFKNGKPVIVPSKQGDGIDPEELASRLIPVLPLQGANRTLTIQPKLVEPAFTTADAEKLGIKERVSDFVTYYPYSPYRDINQSEAARRINGHLIKPGETFSFNEVVGPRTAAAGFVKGNVISGGVFKMDYGGGVSQVATTTFNAAFFAGLDDVEHHPHSLYLSRYPVGREATVSYGALDLRFKNPYDTGIVIRAWVDKSAPGRQGAMHVQMYGTKVYEVTAGQSERRNFRTPGTREISSPTCSPQSPITGFDIDIYRTFKKDGKVVRKETHTTRYKAGDRVVCVKDD